MAYNKIAVAENVDVDIPRVLETTFWYSLKNIITPFVGKKPRRKHIFRYVWLRNYFSIKRIFHILGYHTLRHVISFARHYVTWTYSNSNALQTGGLFNIKTSSYRYRESHCADKTILRPSYLHSGISYTSKMTSLYWFRALTPFIIDSGSGSSVEYTGVFSRSESLMHNAPLCTTHKTRSVISTSLLRQSLA